MATPPLPIPQDVAAESKDATTDPKTDVLAPFPPVEAIILDPDKVSKQLTNTDGKKATESPGQRLPNFSFTASPTATPSSHEKPGLTDLPKNKPSTVFLPDERFTFADSTFP